MRMKRLVKKLAVPAMGAIAALCLSGCVNVIKHVPLGQTVDVYGPTKFVACDAVGVWWNEEYRKKYPIEASWLSLTWLVWVVDLPCEAVADTLWFPYDYYCMRRWEKSQAKREQEGKPRFGASGKRRQYELSGPYWLDIGD